MLSAPAVDLTYEDDDWRTPTLPPKFCRPTSISSWAVTSIGRGFDWNDDEDDKKQQLEYSPHQDLDYIQKTTESPHARKHNHAFLDSAAPLCPRLSPTTPNLTVRMPTSTITATETVASPIQSATSSPKIPVSASSSSAFAPARSAPIRSPSSPRPRRRSSRQRVSLIAGRVSIAPIDSPSSPLVLPQSLRRTDSSNSFLSIDPSTRAPTPSSEKESFLGDKTIADFSIEGDIGRGAYGLVKRAREILPDGSRGPTVVIKQVIKSRILADCWKKHPKHGTIPIEIYVMSAISNTPYILPPRRPWDPSRFSPSSENKSDDGWIEGKTVKGHPNICPLLEFFEDSHFYYLVLPSTTPERQPDQPSPPSDLFDLVEAYPQGLPASSIRTYLGQIADALHFLHSQGIVHRDVKDENVVLGPSGKCILIDFGSSGLIRKHGWDTFSGTLDYAGPEILRGERYHGKEQDVWAFGVVAYVLLIGECPFMTAEETQEGLESPFANASIALDERCADGKEREGEEKDGGSSLGDAAALVRACLQLDVNARPTLEKILRSKFLAGDGGW